MTGQVRLALVVVVAALPVIEPTIALVTSKSVNHHFVTRVAVAPIVVTKRLAHFFNVVPRSSVLSVSETRVVFIATLARLSKAVVAPEPPLPFDAAVTSPLALTVMFAFVKEPTLEFTVARVRAFALFAEPSNEEPALVPSPVIVPIVLPVARAVAVQALPETLVWSHVFVPLKVPVAQSAIVIPLFCMILPVVESKRAIALSVEEAGQ